MRLFIFIVLIITISNPLVAQDKGVFIDNRDNVSYKWVKIGDQIWMAENILFQTNNDQGLYTWFEIMGANNSSIRDLNPYGSYEIKPRKSDPTKMVKIYKYPLKLRKQWIDSVYKNPYTNSRKINAKYQGICPKGWHIPSASELKELITFINDDKFAGKHLRTKEDSSFTYTRKKGSLQITNEAKGWDTYGFNAALESKFLTTKNIDDKILIFRISKNSTEILVNFHPLTNTKGYLRCIKN